MATARVDRDAGPEPVGDSPVRRFLSEWSVLRALHLVVGIGAFYAFGRSGQFMDQELDHLRGMADGPRALYRSGHIYLLFVALVHLTLGLYFRPSRAFLGRAAQYAGSGFLLGALWLLVSGFYSETPSGLIERPSVRQGIVLALNGVLFHGLGSVALWWFPETLRETLPIRRRSGRGGSRGHHDRR